PRRGTLTQSEPLFVWDRRRRPPASSVWSENPTARPEWYFVLRCFPARWSCDPHRCPTTSIKEPEAKGYSLIITACGTLLWHSSGSGQLGLRLSKVRGKSRRQLLRGLYRPTKRTLCRVASAPVLR